MFALTEVLDCQTRITLERFKIIGFSADHARSPDHRGLRTAPLLRGLGWDHGDHPIAYTTKMPGRSWCLYVLRSRRSDRLTARSRTAPVGGHSECRSDRKLGASLPCREECGRGNRSE